MRELCVKTPLAEERTNHWNKKGGFAIEGQEEFTKGFYYDLTSINLGFDSHFWGWG